MAMGLSRNALRNYIWRLEAGQSGMNVEMLKRAAQNLVEI